MEEHATTMSANGVEKLAAALAKAQAKFTNPEKNRTVKVQHKAGGSHSYSYATLDAVLDATRGPLSENGIAFVQLVTVINGAQALVTKLIHESGQSLESVYMLPSGLGIQELGAAITYARRYCACPMLGIAGETDTDGEEAQAAQETADEAKKAQAVDRLKAMASKGQLKDANTGATIKPEDVNKDGTIEQKAKPDPKPEPKKEEEKKTEKGETKEEKKEDNIPMDFPTEADPEIDKRLQAKFREARITLKEFKEYGVRKGHFPADMDLSKLQSTYINTLLTNWDKVKLNIKGGK
jgi:hypothetical protein